VIDVAALDGKPLETEVQAITWVMSLVESGR